MKPSTTKLKILIIEDNEGDFILIEDCLLEEIENPIITRVATFAEATALLSKKDVFDIILLDLILPDAEGTILVNDIVKLANQTPIIVLTGYSDKSFGITTLSMGISDYLLKDELKPLQLYKSISYNIERKKIYNQLSLSEEKYRTLFQLSPQPMWVYDLKTLDFLDVNNAAIHHYGYTDSEFLSMTIKDIRPQVDIPILEQSIAYTKKNDEQLFKGVFRHKKKNGTIIDVEIQSSPIEFNNKNARLVIAIDITELLRIQQDLLASEEALILLNSELEERVAIRTKELVEANRQLESFSYSISHDLQAPIRSIIGLGQIVKSRSAENLSEECLNSINLIISSAKKLSELIKDLLSFSRMGNTDIRKEVIMPSEIVYEVWTNLPQSDKKNAVLKIEELPELYADRSMLTQVFVNLISNAVKYSSKTSEPYIKIDANYNNKQIVFSVQDNGCGFDMQYYDKLFEIFNRLHSPSEYDGTGIGLSIVKLIIEKHGGEVWAEAKVNEGATFYFSIPTKPIF